MTKIRATALLLCAWLAWSASAVTAQQAMYDPTATTRVLLTSPISDDDIFWAEEPAQETPDSPDVLYEISIYWAFGLIYYRIYPSTQALEDNGYLDNGLKVDSDELPGRQVSVMNIGGGAYGACGADLNVLVCAVSDSMVTDYPAGAAMQGVEGGLLHLIRVASPVTQTGQGTLPTVVPLSNATNTPESRPVQTPTPSPIATQSLSATSVPTTAPQPTTVIPAPSALPVDSDRTSERERVAAAAVQIVVISNSHDENTDEVRPLSLGSGTVISPNGLILTNWHVVDEPSLGSSSFLAILLSDGVNPPEPKYIASVVASDPRIDLAVIRITADSNGPIDPASLQLPYITLGDSDAVFLGDQIDIYGYPEMGRGALTFTRGVVSAFPQDQFVPGRAWIATDASISAGSSGGTAVNQDGELIGIPTEGTPLECRPGDSNGNGQFDSDDVGCVPIGSSLGLLRPSNLAVDLLKEAGWSSPPPFVPTEASVSDQFPTATTTPLPTPMLQPTWTPTPLLTATATPTSIPTPTPTPPVDHSVLQLPESLPLAHAACFQIEDEGSRPFDEVAARLGGTEEARDRLVAWGWQESVYRTFACAAPPAGEVGRVEVHLHLFGSSEAAQQAVDYFAQQLVAGSTLRVRGSAPVGDYAVSLGGPTSNGREFTVYASDGPILIRVTGSSTSGIPFSDVFQVARAVLAAQQYAP